MEHIDELSLGTRGKKMDKDKEHPHIASPTTADHTASLMDAPQTLFDVLQQTLVYLGPAIRWGKDPTSSKSNSQNLLPGGAIACCIANICFEAMHPDTMPFRH